MRKIEEAFKSVLLIFKMRVSCIFVQCLLGNSASGFLILTGLPKRGHFCSFLGDNWAVKPCHAVAIIDRLLMLRCTTDTFSNSASINNLTKQVYYFKSIICNDKTYMRYGYIHKRPKGPYTHNRIILAWFCSLNSVITCNLFWLIRISEGMNAFTLAVLIQ